MSHERDRLLRQVSLLDADLGQRLAKHLERTEPVDLEFWSRARPVSVTLESGTFGGMASAHDSTRIKMELDLWPSDMPAFHAWMTRKFEEPLG